MPTNSRLLSRWLVPLWVVIVPLAQQALGQTHKVESGRTVTIEIPGATAAYSLDSFYADAEAEDGIVTVSGKIHGATHVIVVTPGGPQPLDILVVDPPIKLPPGFVNPFASASESKNGYVEIHYDSMAGQVQSQVDFSRLQNGMTLHMHLMGTRLLQDPSQGVSKNELTSAYYQILTPRRDLTLLDQYLMESPLGINGSIVRGLHYRDDRWILHAGFTSVSSFEQEFLPARAEGMVESGYRYALSDDSSLTATYYYFDVPHSDTVGRTGSVALLTYSRSPRENFRFTADAGYSRGLAGSAELEYQGDKDNLKGTIRYSPSTFASLGANSQRGFHGDMSWTHQTTRNLLSDVTMYSSTLNLPGICQSTASASGKLQYRLASHWSAFAGGAASISDSRVPPSPPVRNVGAPVGLSFNSRHFGVQGQYQFSETTRQDTGSNQFRASANGDFHILSATAFASRQNQVPTLSFILSQTPGLQQALQLLDLQVSSIQQLENLLRNNGGLFASGYIQGVTLHLVPLRTQMGGSLNLIGLRKWPQITYNYLYSDDHGITTSDMSTVHSLLYGQRFGSEQISLSYSLMGAGSSGQKSIFKPSLVVAWRHEFHTAPGFLIPERHGTISGAVFRDDGSSGTYQAGMPLISGAELVLDDTRRVQTTANGVFRFTHVPSGKHKLIASYRSSKPIFFTTQSEVAVEENSMVNFGIGFSLSSVMGRVVNDAGQGVPGISIEVHNREHHWTTESNSEGSFLILHIAEGEYQVEIKEDSVPPGYLISELAPRMVKVGSTIPGTAEFTIRALRSIAGRVLRFDTTAAKSVPVAGKLVTLKETAKTSTTDELGRFVFRDLPAGAYTLAVQSRSHEVTKSVNLSPAPSDLTSIDLQIDEKDIPNAGKSTSPGTSSAPL